jgi:hypothetical protein
MTSDWLDTPLAPLVYTERGAELNGPEITAHGLPAPLLVLVHPDGSIPGETPSKFSHTCGGAEHSIDEHVVA